MTFFFKLAECERKVFFFSKNHLIKSASVGNVETFLGAAFVEHKITLHKCPSIPSSDTFIFLGFWCGNMKKRDNLKDLVIDLNMVLKTNLLES
jgi:hypothetical protein